VAFHSGPQNQTLPINRTASFSCSPSVSFGDEVSWIIQLANSNQTLISIQPAQQQQLQRLGFEFSANDATSFVSVSASPSNNGSSLRCRKIDLAVGNVFTETALLTVVGKLEHQYFFSSSDWPFYDPLEEVAERRT